MPDKIALQYKTSCFMTYQTLVHRAEEFSRVLRALNVSQGSVIPVCFERSFELVIVMLGILMHGSAYSPIDPFQPQLRKELIASSCKAELVIIENGSCWTPSDRRSKCKILIYEREELLELLSISKAEPDVQRENRKPSNVAYVIFTSGTTGTPKGVVIDHKNATSYLSANEGSAQLKAVDRRINLASVTFDVAVTDIWGALANGATLCLNPTNDVLQCLAQILETQLITSYEATPTLLQTQPTYWSTWLNSIYVGGEACPPTLANELHKLQHIKVVNSWGPTETTVEATAHPLTPSQVYDQWIPIGRPFGQNRLYIANPDSMALELLAIGAVGELCVAGPQVAPGYLNNAVLSSSKFLEDPFSPGERVFRTGDVGRLDSQGVFWCFGRSDGQVKLHGRRVELAEIEGALMASGLLRSAVVRKVVMNDGSFCVAAFVVLREDLDNTQTNGLEKLDRDLLHTISSVLSSQLPLWMVPTVICKIGKLPLTQSGKLNSGTLEDSLRSLSNFARSSFRLLRSDAEKQEPKSEEEIRLHAIWCEILGIPNISVNSTLQQLGADLITIIRLLNRCHKAGILGLKLADFAGCCNIASQAEKLGQRRSSKLCKTQSSPSLGSFGSSKLYEDLKYTDNFIVAPIKRKAKRSYPLTVLVTGASGFLGGHIIKDLLQRPPRHVKKILAHGRAFKAKSAKLRVQDRLISLGCGNYKDPRLLVLEGDLSEDKIGLSNQDWDLLCATADVYIHNGAQVDGLKPYGELRSSNVVATQQLLDAAGRRAGTSFVLVSTASICLNGKEHDHKIEDEQYWDDLGGYVQTKAVAERMTVQAAHLGLHCSIVRPGLIANSSDSGVINASDWIWRLFIGCSQVNIFPSSEATVDMNPADYVARLCVLAGLSPDPDLRFYQTELPDCLKFSDLFSLTGATPLAIKDWRRQIEHNAQANPELTTLLHFGEFLVQCDLPDTSSTRQLLETDPSGLSVPRSWVEKEDIQRVRHWLQEQNLLSFHDKQIGSHSSLS